MLLRFLSGGLFKSFKGLERYQRIYAKEGGNAAYCKVNAWQNGYSKA